MTLSPRTQIFALVLLLSSTVAFAQLDEGRQALDRGEYVRATEMLSAALAERPTPDTYLYLAIAFGRLREYTRAEDILQDAIERYPEDPRFHNELANLFLENNDTDAARAALRRSLSVDPENDFASDQLAIIDMSEGNVRSALQAWNKRGRPYINDVLHNNYSSFGSWMVHRAVVFRPAEPLRYEQWRTTQARLFATGIYSNVGIEIEPAVAPDRYNGVIRTTRMTNTPPDLLFGLARGLPFKTSFLDIWNIGNSGLSFNGNYRWDYNRRRLEGRLTFPLPVAGLLYLDLGSSWRSEQWNVGSNLPEKSQPDSPLVYKATALHARVKHIPHYRLELAAGFEYRNRAAQGNLPQIFTNGFNTGRFTAEANVWLVDGQYQSRLRVEAFTANSSIIGNTDFTGGVAELTNRITLSPDTETSVDWSVKAGTAHGALPVEDYFLLGLDQRVVNPLRGHTAQLHGIYGNGPMGSDFVLLNTSFRRRLAVIPLFNTLNIPFITVKGEAFLDLAKTRDRNHVFLPSKLLADTGAGLRFETPTYSFNLTAGRSLRTGDNVFSANYERRLW